MKKHLSSRLLSMLLVIALLVGFAVPVSSVSAAEDTQNRLSFEKIDADGFTMDGLDETDELETNSDQNYEDTDVVRVSIVLESQSVMERGYSTLNIAENVQAMECRETLRDEQAEITAAIENAIDGELDVAWNLTLAANIISANVEYGQIGRIAQISGVKEVVLETRYEPAVYSSEKVAEPQTATSGSMIGTSAAYASGYTGAGSRIAVIDTGIDTDHQSFSNAGFSYSLAYQAGLAGMELETYLESLNLLDVEEIASVQEQLNISVTAASDLYINTKIPYAFNYIDEDLDVTHDNDSAGEHGSHVEGIAAANAFIANGDGTFSKAIDTVLAQGVAPDAQLIVMKVFGKNGGAYDSDYMAAIEDAIVLGCDSVNLSLGTAAHGFTYTATYQEIMDRLTECDTVVTCSGGNNGAWMDNAVSGIPYLYNTDVSMYAGGAPGAYTNSLAVASVNNDGVVGNYFVVGEHNIFFNDGQSSKNASLLTFAGNTYEYVLIDSVGTAEEFAAIAEVLEGKIAVCSRGTNSFFEKANAAVSNGAIGVVIANNTAGVIYLNMSGYSYKAPVVSITQLAGQQMKEAAKAVTDENGNVLYYLGSMTVAADLAAAEYNSEYYTMSDFSAWGVPGSLELKPEITAPGGNIYSVDGSVEGGQAYEIMSGTSMAAPQVAGMAAIVAQYIRENGLDEKTGLSTRQLAQSLLMSTATPLFEEDNGGNYYAVLKQGSGLANVGNAVTAQSYILMGEDATESWKDGKIKAELGDDPDRTGEYSFSFTVNNFSAEAKTYTLAADFFTQSVFGYNGEIYLDKWTTPLPAEVNFTVDGETFVPVSSAVCDLDADGDTDADDAQIIVSYCAGLSETIDPIADVNADGEITTYDAYLILDSMETREISVAAGGKVSVTVKVTLSDSLKQVLDAYYPNGAYVEGYVYVLPTSTEEGVITDVTHSIPVLGFYGNWTDASMYEPVSYTSYIYGDYQFPYTGYVSNNLIIKYPGDKNTYWQIGNPYFLEADGYPAERTAISSGSTLYSYPVGLMRNADALVWLITNEDGEVLSMSSVANRVYGSYYYANYASWQNTVQELSINKKVSALGLAEGDKFTVSVVAVPEYYQTNGALTSEQVLKLMKDGTLGKGAYLSTTMTVDDTAPEIFDIYKDMKTGNLVVTAKDNNYVAAIQITNVSGRKTYGYGFPAQSEAGQTCIAEVDLTGAAVGEECVVLVADYANNISAYQITYGGEGEDFSGRMFAFTSTSLASTGSGARWMEIDPDHLYVSYTGYEGLTQVDTMDDSINLTAAEYVDGYVFMAASNGKLYVAEQGEWSFYKEVGDFSGTTGKIWDLAFNYTDYKLYAVGDDSIVYTVDLITGELTQAFTVSLTNPATSGASARKLRGLAIDGDGNFYATNSGSSWSTFLYKWTKDDIVDGAVTNLAPVVNNRNNDADYYTSEGGLAWDYTTDTLYWCCAQSTSYSSSNNILVRFNLETGKAEKASSYYGNSSSTYASRLGDYYTAFYIVPGSTEMIPPTTNASEILIDTTEISVLKGSQFTINATVYPWNLVDDRVIWTSSDESVAVVENGEVSAIGVGKTTITVTTVASPNLQATCEVTVSALPSTNISALIYDADSVTHWSEFNTDDTTKWVPVSGESQYFIGGAMVDGMIYAHDGSTMYAIDPDSFVETAVGSISSTWIWSDAAPAPMTADGKVFGRTVGVCYNGTYLELVNVPAGTLNYFDLSSTFSSDPMATIAYVGSGTYTVPATNYISAAEYPTVNYYIMTEGGNIWYLSIYAVGENRDFEICEQTYIGHVDLDLEGVSAVVGGTYASMIYDQATGYLMLAHYGEGETAKFYAIDLNTMLAADIGTFGENVWPVVSLYQYTRPTDLTVRITPSVASIYEKETASFTAKVLPATFTGGVVWSSSDENIATVDQNGNVTGVGEGVATITATSVNVNANGEKVSASVNVTVEALVDLDITFHGQVTTADGTSKWATIKTTDLSTYTVDGTSNIVLKGGGGHEGEVWGHNIEPTIVNNWTWWNFITIDLKTYETENHGWTMGAEDIDDLTTAPAYKLKTKNKAGEEFYTEAMGKPLYVSNATYVEFLKKDYIDDYYYDTYMFTGLRNYADLAAIAFVGMTESTGYTAEEFYVLCSNGDLIRLVIELRPTTIEADNFYQRYWRHSYLGNIGVDFVRSDDLSMVCINDGTNHGLMIAESGNGKGELFYVDLKTEGYAARKVGTLSGATYLTSLYTDYELNYDNGEGDAVKNPIGGEGTNTSSSEALLMCDTYTGEALAEEPVTETNAAGGSTNTITGEVITKEHPQVEVNGGNATTGDYTVAINLSETENVTNGLFRVTYDPKVLTYSGTTTAMATNAVKVDAENGVVTFAYATVNALPAGSTLATLNFTYTAEYINTEVTVSTTQRNKTSKVEEDATAIAVTYEVGGHGYEVTESVDATCTEDGYKVYTCTKCGDSYREDIISSGHDYEAKVTAPTCTDKGYTTYTCSVCGDSYVSDHVDAAGHNYEATVTAPTCTEHGYTTYTCTGCGDSYVSDYVDATGHSFGEWVTVTEPDCDSKGQEKRVCACGETEYRDIDPTGHSYESVVIDPTCTASGYTVHTCSVCGDSYITDLVDATGHSYGEWTTVTEPTCTETGLEERVCSACGETETRAIAMLDHEYTAAVVEPTCTEGGYTLYTCACGDSYIADLVSATGHSYTATVVAPTCTAYGYTVYTCDDCDHSYISDYVAAHCASENFTDVDADAWYHEAVDYVIDAGLMNGKSATVFAPNANLTRAELVTVLYRMAGTPSVEGLENPFADVAADQWYTDAVIWAVNAGVVNGMSKTVFAPNANITREQIATILYRFTGAQEAAEDALSSYADAAQVSDWAYDAMNWAVANGLINGMNDGTLAPKASATRAQIATILMRYCELAD